MIRAELHRRLGHKHNLRTWIPNPAHTQNRGKRISFEKKIKKRKERKSERGLEKEKERGESIRRVRDQRRTQEHNQPPFPRTRAWFELQWSLKRKIHNSATGEMLCV
ncbi:hypothetical protein QL285_038394 [Trifolium repens]|nr:hypothetical protein QL285_038394 [Trifolium repens]